MPEQEQPQQYPMLNVSLIPDGSGMVISTILMPGVEINRYSLGEGIMNQICGQWLESRRQLKKELEVIQDIQATKGRQSLKLLRQGKE